MNFSEESISNWPVTMVNIQFSATAFVNNNIPQYSGSTYWTMGLSTNVTDDGVQIQEGISFYTISNKIFKELISFSVLPIHFENVLIPFISHRCQRSISESSMSWVRIWEALSLTINWMCSIWMCRRLITCFRSVREFWLPERTWILKSNTMAAIVKLILSLERKCYIGSW